MLATPKDCMNFSKKFFASYSCKHIILYTNIICAIRAANTLFVVSTSNIQANLAIIFCNQEKFNIT